MIVLRERHRIEFGEPFQVAKRDGVERFDRLGNRSAVENRQLASTRWYELGKTHATNTRKGPARSDQSAPR